SAPPCRQQASLEGEVWHLDRWCAGRRARRSWPWGRHDRLDVHASVALTDLRALPVWVARLVAELLRRRGVARSLRSASSRGVTVSLDGPVSAGLRSVPRAAPPHRPRGARGVSAADTPDKLEAARRRRSSVERRSMWT